MSSIDSPDWQEVVQVQYGGTLTDAPDWVHTVTGPGGNVIPGASGAASNQPGDIGSLGWSIDYRLAQYSTLKLVSGHIYGCTVQCVVGGTSSSPSFWQTAVASGLTTGDCAVALYDGDLFNSTPYAIASSAQTIIAFQDAPVGGYGVLSGPPWITPYTVEVGVTYALLVLVTGTTPPTLGFGPYPGEAISVGNYDLAFVSSSGGYTSLATNTFAADMEPMHSQIWGSLGT